MLGAFGYSMNQTVLHTDGRFLPRIAAAHRRGTTPRPPAPAPTRHLLPQPAATARGRHALPGDSQPHRRHRPGRHPAPGRLRAPPLHRGVAGGAGRAALDQRAPPHRLRRRLPRQRASTRTAAARAWQPPAGSGAPGDGPPGRLAGHPDLPDRGHARRGWTPLRNEFRYRSRWSLVDVDRLPRVPRPLRALVRFEASPDHLGDPALTLRQNVERHLAAEGVDAGGGPITLLTVPRALRHVFNPLSVFWCHRPDGSLAATLAEVHNTYGGRHVYTVRTDERGTGRTDKAFYVSPFYPVDGSYTMSLPEPGERAAALGHVAPHRGSALRRLRPRHRPSRHHRRGGPRRPHLAGGVAAHRGADPLAGRAAVAARSARSGPDRRRTRPPGHPPPARRGHHRPQHPPEELSMTDTRAHEAVTRPAGPSVRSTRPAGPTSPPCRRPACALRSPTVCSRTSCGGSTCAWSCPAVAPRGPAAPRHPCSSCTVRTTSRAVSAPPGSSGSASRTWRATGTPPTSPGCSRCSPARWPRSSRPGCRPSGGSPSRRCRARTSAARPTPVATSPRTTTSRTRCSSCSSTRRCRTPRPCSTRPPTRRTTATRWPRARSARSSGCSTSRGCARARPSSRSAPAGARLALRAARRGARVHTITLSVEQAQLARDRVAAAGLSDLVQVEVCDYRDTTGQYDAVVSVEMIEAVGHAYWADYFRTVSERTAPHGRAVIQAITMPHDRMLATRDAFTWIQKYIFPGGFLPSTESITADARRAGLVVQERLAFGQHYARTLQIWRDRFEQHADQVAARRLRRGVPPDVVAVPRLLRGRLRLRVPRRPAGRPRPPHPPVGPRRRRRLPMTATLTAADRGSAPADGGVARRLAEVVEPLFHGPLPVRLRAWDGSEAGPADAPGGGAADPGRPAPHRVPARRARPRAGVRDRRARGRGRSARRLPPRVGTGARRGATGRLTPSVAGQERCAPRRDLGVIGRPPAPPASEARLRGRLHTKLPRPAGDLAPLRPVERLLRSASSTLRWRTPAGTGPVTTPRTRCRTPSATSSTWSAASSASPRASGSSTSGAVGDRCRCTPPSTTASTSPG